MTLIAAFRCADGLLMVADREEATASAKRSVPKIVTFLGEGNWAVAVATAGNAATADLAVSRLGKRLKNVSSKMLRRESEKIIREVVEGVYRDCIWSNPDRDRDQLDFSLLVAVNLIDSEEQFLYRTAGIVPQPLRTHVCIGVGEDLANYFADRLYTDKIGRRELTLLTAFIFREAKRSVRDVGQGTDMCFMFKGAGVFMTGGESLESLEADLPAFSDSIKKFWERARLMPRWLKDERLDLGAIQRRAKRLVE
jgi:20S proteasome alpha/beta subunit